MCFTEKMKPKKRGLVMEHKFNPSCHPAPARASLPRVWGLRAPSTRFCGWGCGCSRGCWGGFSSLLPSFSPSFFFPFVLLSFISGNKSFVSPSFPLTALDSFMDLIMALSICNPVITERPFWGFHSGVRESGERP